MLPPTGTPAARTHPTATSSATTSSATIPAAIARLAAHSVIAATVVGRDGEAVILRTEAGPISLVTRLVLEAGAELSLRLRPGSSPSVVIETIDGAPPKDLARPPLGVIRPVPAPIAPPLSALPQSALPLSPATAAAPAPLAPPATLAVGAPLVATVIALAVPDAPAVTATGASIAGAAPLAIGDRVAFRLAPLAPSIPAVPSEIQAPAATGVPTPAGSRASAGPPALAGSPAPVAPAITTAGSKSGAAPPGQFASGASASLGGPAAVSVSGGSAPLPGTARPSPSTPGAPPPPTPLGRGVSATVSPRAPSPGPPLPLAPSGPAAADGKPAAAAAIATPGSKPSTASGLAATAPRPTITGAVPTVAAPSPPSPTTPSLATPPAAVSVTAMVTGIDGAGRALLATPLGLLRVESPAALAVGERLALAELAPPARPATLPATGAPLADIAGDWFALRAVIEALGGAEAAVSMLDRAVPAPGHKLAATALFFLTVLRGGDLGGWLGQGTLARLERAGHGEAVTRLAADFAQLARTADAPAAGQWQVMVIPILAEGIVRPLRFHVRRHDRDGEDADGEEGGTRFVMEFALSRLGALQLDGLVRERHFDLILRSRERVADDMRRAVTAIFTDGLAAVGYAGRIGFHVARRLPPMPGDAARPPAGVTTVA